MPLSAGTKFGPYGIVAPLGAGGMGEVYRARDSKLQREVALKVLPDEFARDPDRMARFRREAEMLGSRRSSGHATGAGSLRSKAHSSLCTDAHTSSARDARGSSSPYISIHHMNPTIENNACRAL
jgi:serine/threonine protein kinase